MDVRRSFWSMKTATKPAPLSSAAEATSLRGRTYFNGSNGYLIAIALLVINDLVLKAVFPGIVTGKLSDFAGLFAFAAFFSALAPRYSTVVCIASGVLFVFWKSPLSQPLIELWPWAITRVVDRTDLLALLVLPFARLSAAPLRTSLRPAIAMLSLFAFAATSLAGQRVRLANADPSVRFAVEMEPATLAEHFERCGLEPIVDAESSYLGIHYESGIVESRINASAEILRHRGGTVLAFRELTVAERMAPADESALRAELTRQVGDCLRK